MPFRGSALAIARQLDGKVVFGGVSETGGRAVIALVRTDASLVRDATFGVLPDGGVGGGVVTHDASTSAYQALFGIAFQSDGKIIVVGAADTTAPFDLDARNLRRGAPAKLLVVRMMPDGQLDPTFGSGGKLETFPQGQNGATGRLGAQRANVTGTVPQPEPTRRSLRPPGS